MYNPHTPNEMVVPVRYDLFRSVQKNPTGIIEMYDPHIPNATAIPFRYGHYGSVRPVADDEAF